MANWFTNLLTNLIGSARSASTLVQPIGSPEVYSPIEARTAVQEGFNANTAVYSIVKKAAKKFASVTKYLENKQTDEEMDDHPLMKLLERPNPYESQDAFLMKAYGFFKTCGETFIWLNRGDVANIPDDNGNLADASSIAYMKNPVLEMYVLPSDRVTIVPDDESIFGVKGYILESNSRIPIRKEDIIHWRDLNLDFDITSRQHLHGMPALKPGYRTLTADNAAVGSMVRMFQNDGAKGAIVNKTVGRAPTPRQQSQLDAVMDEKVNNKERKNQIVSLEGDWSFLNFGLTAVDMETLKGREFIYKELCFLFGVPYELFDSQVTYANKQTAKKGWILDEIEPDCKQLDGELNRFLPLAFGLAEYNLDGQLTFKAQICSDIDDLPEMQEDNQTKVAALSKIPITMNEFREAMDYEAINDPKMDEVMVPQGVQLLSEAGIDPAMADLMTQINQNGNQDTAPGGANGQSMVGNSQNSNGKIPNGAQGTNMLQYPGKNGRAKATVSQPNNE